MDGPDCGAGQSAGSRSKTPESCAAHHKVPGNPTCRLVASSGNGAARSWTKAATFSAVPRPEALHEVLRPSLLPPR